MNRIVVADAGPLHYLVLINCAEILAGLFDQVLIPPAVQAELLQSNTPQKVKDWMTTPRSWLQVEPVRQSLPIAGLHPGEMAALQLALQSHVSGVLMDDMDGRAEARKLGLVVIGTIGLLERAAEKGLIELPVAFAGLQKTNFFIAEELLTAALARDRQRKQA